MEADISIWRKTGHFYFALTETLYHAANRVATITLNRPDKLNAWTWSARFAPRWARRNTMKMFASLS